MKRLIFSLVFATVWMCSSQEAVANDFLGKNVNHWINELRAGKTPQARRSAAFAIGKLGFGGAPAVRLLVEVLKDPDPGLREASAFALGEIGSAMGEINGTAWQSAGPALVNLLKSPEPNVRRRSAAFAIGCYGPRASTAKEALKAALDDESATVRQNAAWAIGKLGAEAGKDGVERLSKVLIEGSNEKNDAAVRRDAAAALGEIGRPLASSAVPALAECCKRDQDNHVRKAALDSLVSLAGPEDQEALPALKTLLKHEDLEVARGAAFAMGNIGGKDAAPALPILRISLSDENPQIKSLAAAAISGLGPEAAPAVPELSLSLADSDGLVRRNSAVALGRIGEGAAPAVQMLAQAINARETDVQVRRYAAEALANIGPAVEKAVPNLLAALRDDKDAYVRLRTVWALFRIRDLKKSGAVETLTKVLSESGADAFMVRCEAARCLALHLGAEAPEKTVDVLLEYLKEKEARVYNRTDAKVGGGSEGKDGSSNVAPNLGGDARFLAAEAVAKIGKAKAKRADIIEALKELQKSPDKRCQEEAAKALAALQ